MVSKGLLKLTDINTLFHSFGAYTNTSNDSYLYAFSDVGIYEWNSAGSTFNTSALESYTANVGEPWAIVDYTDGLYFTRHGVTLRRVVASTVGAAIGTGFQAKYAKNAHDHLMLANLNETSGQYKVMWSDLFDFTNFVPSTSNEADTYSFNPAYGEITGVTIQRDIVNFYLEKAIFQAKYVGYPLKYILNPLFTELGNKYHHAVIQTQDVDYFIGEDNFYKLEGTILTPIGNEVWEFFRESLSTIDYGQEIRGVHDVDRNRVGWLYTRKYDETYPDGLRASKKYWLWFSYKESRWSSEEADFISLYKPQRRLYFYEAIDDQAQTITSETRVIDGLWQATEFIYQGGLFGGEDESIYVTDTGYDGKTLHFETAEMHFEQPYIVKTLERVTLHGDAGSLVSNSDLFYNVSVSIGYRRADANELTWVVMTASSRPETNTMEYVINPADVPAAHSFALRFTFDNSAAVYITAIHGFTLTFNAPHDANDRK